MANGEDNMPRGRPPISTDLHLIRGTFRTDRHGCRPDAPRPTGEDQLTDDQRALLHAVPRELGAVERQIYVDHARLGWWLRPIDRAALVTFAVASATYSTAGRALDACMKSPDFANPKSEAAQAGKAYCRIADQAAKQVLAFSDLLGFSPRARERLGIRPGDRPQPLAKDDPWALLRLVRRQPAEDPT
jgi:hypothetical protein